MSGFATNINREDAVFDINVEQWVSATKVNEPFPARFRFPDKDRRFEKGKPLPSNGKPVTVMGYLAGIGEVISGMAAAYRWCSR